VSPDIRSDDAKISMSEFEFELLGEKGRGKPEHTLCTPLSFIETQELQIHLRHSEKLRQVEVLKNRRR
jgi:hypothetical protein